jgi:hypothetical protein
VGGGAGGGTTVAWGGGLSPVVTPMVEVRVRVSSSGGDNDLRRL